MMDINFKQIGIMKVFNKIMILLALTFIVGACEDEDLTVLNPNATTTVSLSSTDLVLDKNDVGMNVLTVNWTEPDYGFNAADSYNILFDLAGGDFTKPQVVSGGSDFSKSFTTEQLNKILLNLGAETGTATDVDVKVNAVLSSRVKLASNVTSMMVTPYADVLDLSTAWGVVGNATPNGWGTLPDTPFYKTDEAGVYVAYITMIQAQDNGADVQGYWKIRKDNAWDVNYGSDNADGTLQAGGSDIPVDPGTYKIVFDENELTYTITKYAWGIVGSATPNEWNGPDMPLTYDPYSDTWRAVVTLVDGAIKIRQNNDWAVSYGDKNLDGILDQEDGNDIIVTAGNYEVIVDFNDLSYSLEETDIWGVVGSGYNDWGAAGPDAAFTPDYSKDGVFYLKGVTLLDGMIKFRTNNVWGNDYGDVAPMDGILDKEGGNDIPSTAGVYDIILDFSNPDVPTYTITAK
jgi:hypothetical protein